MADATDPHARRYWVDGATGCFSQDKRPGWIEIRSAGAGWRWHDVEGREWATSSGPGNSGPRWYRIGGNATPSTEDGRPLELIHNKRREAKPQHASGCAVERKEPCSCGLDDLVKVGITPRLRTERSMVINRKALIATIDRRIEDDVQRKEQALANPSGTTGRICAQIETEIAALQWVIDTIDEMGDDSATPIAIKIDGRKVADACYATEDAIRNEVLDKLSVYASASRNPIEIQRMIVQKQVEDFLVAMIQQAAR